MKTYLKIAVPVVTIAALAFAFQNCSSDSSYNGGNGGNNAPQSACPPNFVLVPGSTTFATTDFCVSKFEAKQVNNLPESAAVDTPWVNITRDQAKAACLAKGAAYKLLDNNHWMTIARDIESVAWNFGGDAGLQEYGISRGLTNNSGVTGVAASADDNDSCYLATQSTHGPAAICDLNTYDVARRVAKLSNGSLIWDFAGNVSEWISDDFAQNYNTKAWILNLTAGAVKDTFGPSGNYPPGPTNPTGNIYMYNLGYISSIMAPPYVVLRGGGFNYGRYSGIYTAYFAPVTQAAPDTGFRCYYQP